MILTMILHDSMDKMNRMLEALKARAEQQKTRKHLTAEEMREKIRNSDFFKKHIQGERMRRNIFNKKEE